MEFYRYLFGFGLHIHCLLNTYQILVQVPQDPEGGLLDKIHKDPDSPSLTPDPTPTSIKESEDTKPSISIKPSEITPSPDLEPTEIPNVTEPPQDSTSDNDYIYFTISSGMNSDQVAELVKEKGLISNAQEFDKYLVDNGYANRIRLVISSASAYRK